MAKYSISDFPEETTAFNTPLPAFFKTEPQSPADFRDNSRYSSFYFSFFESKNDLPPVYQLQRAESADNLFHKRRSVIKELDKLRSQIKTINKKLARDLSIIKEIQELENIKKTSKSDKEGHIGDCEVSVHDVKCYCLKSCRIF